MDSLLLSCFEVLYNFKSESIFHYKDTSTSTMPWAKKWSRKKEIHELNFECFLHQLRACYFNWHKRSLVLYSSKGYIAPNPTLAKPVDCSRGPASKGWIAQMEAHWYGNLEVSGWSPVKLSLPIFRTTEICEFAMSPSYVQNDPGPP